jgi:lysophospholipase
MVRNAPELNEKSSDKEETASDRWIEHHTHGTDSGRREEDRLDFVDRASDEPQVSIHVYSCPVDHDGTSIYLKAWMRPDNPNPPIILVHGLRENIGVYRDVTKALVAAGYDVFGFDLRGHGRSGRVLGHIPSFDSLVSDLLQVVAWVRHLRKRRNPIIVSQGIGALIAINFCRRYPHFCAGTVLAAPCLFGSATRLERFFIKVLTEIAPLTRLPGWITPKFLAAYNHSTRQRLSGPILRWGFYGITANFVNEILKTVAAMPLHFQEYKSPSLILSPSKDALYDYSQLHQLVAEHSCRELIEVVNMDEAGHHVLSGNPQDLEQAMKSVVPWLKKIVDSSCGMVRN